MVEQCAGAGVGAETRTNTTVTIAGAGVGAETRTSTTVTVAGDGFGSTAPVMAIVMTIEVPL